MESLRILLVEDDKIDQISFTRYVKEHQLPYAYSIAASVAEARQHLAAEVFDIVLSDFNLGDGNALDLLTYAHELPLIITTGAGTEETAVKALKAGAYDYLIKDHQRNYLKVLPVTVEKVLERHRSDERMRLLLHAIMNIEDSVYITDAGGRITFVNQGFCLTYGYPEKDVIGRSPTMFEGSATAGECTHRRADGSLFHVLRSCSTIKDTAGKELATVTVARDITERKKSEEALRVSEEQYHSFFDDDLAGDFIATPDGRMLACNKSFARMFGFSSVEEALQYNLNALYGTPLAAAELMEMLRFNRKLEHHEMVFRRIDGQPVYVIQNIVGKFDASGALAEFKGYMFDNTQHKQLEEQLRQAQKMESIGTLAGGIAHDFNNILTIILGHASVLRQGKHEIAARVKSLDTITAAVQRGANLVKQILTFARQDGVEVKPVSVNSLVEELVHMLRETFPKTVSFSLCLDPCVPLTVADQSQLHQVLLNLCVNARDAMPKGGVITVATEVINGPDLRQKFPDAFDDRYVKLRVTDTGEGIPEEIRNRIFEPFFTTKEIGRGTGLGLAVAYGAMKSHKGIIDVESERGLGTTFTLYLPVVMPPQPTAARTEAPREESMTGSGTILLVEDEDILLDLVKGFLEGQGFDVIAARDGEQAVALYSEHKDRIALVLTDLGLPRLDGWGAFLRMKEMNPKVKVVVASGYVDPNLRATMLRAGARDLVQKPYLPQEILTRVKALLQDSPEVLRN